MVKQIREGIKNEESIADCDVGLARAVDVEDSSEATNNRIRLVELGVKFNAFLVRALNGEGVVADDFEEHMAVLVSKRIRRVAKFQTNIIIYNKDGFKMGEVMCVFNDSEKDGIEVVDWKFIGENE